MTPPPTALRRLACVLAGFGLLVGAALAADAPAAAATPAAAPVAAAPASGAQKPSVSTQATMRTPPVRTAPLPRAEAKPTWTELTPAQQQALAPLTGTWQSLGESHKRKWLAVSQNFPTMPPGEQARLHSRMAEWAALSPQQRTLARLNFAATQQVSPDVDKRAQWEAYQALSAEEKRKLAAGAAAAKPPPTAVSVQPVPQQKLANIPKPRKADNTSSKIAVVPGQVDNNTLLPHPLAPIAP